MQLNQKRFKAGGNAAPRRKRDAASRLSQPRLQLVRSEDDGGDLAGQVGRTIDVCHPIAAGQLVVRLEPRDGVSILWLSGALDRATTSLLERELHERAVHLMRLIVDLTGVDFIDFAGFDSLARTQRRASERGVLVSFRYGPHVVERPFDLARALRLRAHWAPRPAGVGVSDDDFYFALAMACVDVDHPGDRPGAA